MSALSSLTETPKLLFSWVFVLLDKFEITLLVIFPGLDFIPIKHLHPHCAGLDFGFSAITTTQLIEEDPSSLAIVLLITQLAQIISDLSVAEEPPYFSNEDRVKFPAAHVCKKHTQPGTITIER